MPPRGRGPRSASTLRCGWHHTGADCPYVAPSAQDGPVTLSVRSISALAIGLLAMGLAACSSETAPTGWIPSDGAITGVITTTSVFPAALRTALRTAPAQAAGVAGGGQTLPTPPRVASLMHRLTRAALRARRPHATRPTA